MIVDSDADLDEAVPGIVSSAFVYAGQKCSAAARVIIHEAIADQLTERVAGAVSVLVVGQADQLGTDVPPVIERARRSESTGTRRSPRPGPDRGAGRRRAEHGWFCPPTVAADLPPDSPVLNEEIFGPLLAIDRVKNVAHACDIVDGLPFALTGGLFARDPATVRYVRERSPVGNLYVNRGITGAMVGRQPFGGNRLSGTGSKAGGPDYLRQFVEPHVVTENTMRHGLVVEAGALADPHPNTPAPSPAHTPTPRRPIHRKAGRITAHSLPPRDVNAGSPGSGADNPSLSGDERASEQLSGYQGPAYGKKSPNWG